jgi:subtilisin family serine protease
MRRQRGAWRSARYGWFWRLLAAVGVLAVTGVGALTASADPETSAVTAADPVGAPPGLGGFPTEHEVTLITGDVATVRRGPGGQYEATVEAAPRPDAAPVSFETLRTPQGDLYVYPSDASALIASGVLDRALFNLRDLVESGYADAKRTRLPVIVEYRRLSAAEERERAQDLPASELTHALTSIDAAAVAVRKPRADDFWSRLRASLRSDVKKVWLDAQLTVDLSESVPQVGAPAAWAAGYDGSGTTVAVLDTGYDAAHPDLAGNVVASRSFVPGLTVHDGHGHGTHVASTVAGSGAAQGGAYKGVAPGAALAIGRICSDRGSCASSAIIDGMEWAAREQRADVVNMSLGSGPTDGTDPLSQAVNALTAETGTLFVVSAGNSGPGSRTVGAPAAADAALAVASVDKSDRIAATSSRGPRFGDEAIKPDIAAPGVGIVAARSAGTDMQGGAQPVSDTYIRASGTSMAAPHVAGAAAILAQRRPEWSPEELKAALTGSARSAADVNPYERGSGHLDVAAAIEQTLTASPSSVSFGSAAEPASKTVTLTNHAAQPVTVTLSAQAHNPRGEPANGVFTIAQPTVTVPADGTADVSVRFDHGGGPFGTYGGVVRAVDAGGEELLRLAVGATRPEPTHTLTLRAVPPENWPHPRASGGDGVWHFARVDAPQDPIAFANDPSDHTITAQVPQGVYWLILSFDGHADPETGDGSYVHLSDPEFVVDGDRELMFDARAARPITIATPRPSEPYAMAVARARGTSYGGGEWVFGAGSLRHDGVFLATPTQPVSTGTFRQVAAVGMMEPPFTMRALGADPMVVHTEHTEYSQGPRADLDRTMELVDVGEGSAAEIERARVRGRIALFSYNWRADPDWNVCLEEKERTDRPWQRLKDAGAVAVVAFLDVDREARFPQCGNAHGSDASTLVLPVVTVGAVQGRALRERARRGPVRVDVRASSDVDYTYQLRFDELDRIPDDLSYRVSDRELAAVDARYHAPKRSALVTDWQMIRPGDSWIVRTEHLLSWAPSRRTDYFLAARDVLWDGEGLIADADHLTMKDVGADKREYDRATRVFERPTGQDERWFLAPQSPGAVQSGPEVAQWYSRYGHTLGFLARQCAFCRVRLPIPLAGANDQLFTALPHAATGGHGHFSEDLAWRDGSEFRLYREGVEIPAAFAGFFNLDAYREPSRYRLDFRYRRTSLRPYPGEVTTSWDFTSRAVTAADPAAPAGFACFGLIAGPCRVESMLLLGFDLSRAVEPNSTTARAPGDARFDVRVYQQPGAPRSRVRGLELDVSFDGGERWERPERVRSRGDGRYEVTIDHPRLSRTSGTVSLRAEAWDDAGNRARQTMLDAYGLRDDDSDSDSDSDSDD